jgi:TPR repeat protein
VNLERFRPKVREQLNELVAHLERVAAAGNTDALALLAEVYSGGFGVPPDEMRARAYLLRGVEADNALSLFEYGAYLRRCCPDRLAEAQELNTRAVKKGFAPALFDQGVDALFGKGRPVNIPDAVRLIKAAADAGWVPANALLGSMYLTGHQMPVDLPSAFIYTTAAAKCGEVAAEYNLGVMYLRGQGVGRNLDFAFELYRRAARKGHSDAWTSLANRYFNGEGTPKNSQRGMALLEEGAALGLPDIKARLGYEYFMGVNVTKDRPRAIQLIQEAAGANSGMAMWLLSVMYRTGEGLAQNDQEARRWALAAAEKGIPEAKAWLRQQADRKR